MTFNRGARGHCPSPGGVRSGQSPAIQAPAFINLVEPWPYPFSLGRACRDMLYLAGQIGSVTVDGKPQLVAGGIDNRNETDARKHQSDLAKSRLVDGARREVLGDDGRHGRMAGHEHDLRDVFSRKEARAIGWGATGLALNARVEIECLAMAGRCN
jgi:enamine deaminase RidA (YjgF/YER057c/UK114 family)